MPQAAFAYDVAFPESRRRSGASSEQPPHVSEHLSPTVSVFADRAHLRAQLVEDLEAAGLTIGARAGIGTLLDGPAQPLGDIVLLDCPSVDGAELAALSRLDLRAARTGAQLVISTSVSALDQVFACTDQSDPLILVDPTRAERAVALGEALGRLSGSRVREMPDDVRMAVLRLTEQVGQIAQRLDRLGAPPVRSNIVPFDGERARTAPPAFRGDLAVAPVAAGLPDARLVRRVLRQRQLRGRFLDPELFADPAWDMLLDLTAAASEKVRVSVSSLCIAAAVPATTALRWIRQMTDVGLLARIEDNEDRRRAFIVLTERSRTAMSAYFAALGQDAAIAV